MNNHLGKITSVKFGLGGYQECCLGLTVVLEYDHYCKSVDFKGAWDPSQIEWYEHCKWTEDDRDKQLAEMARFVSKLLSDAKVNEVTELIGKPVEVTCVGGRMESWRILTEVL